MLAPSRSPRPPPRRACTRRAATSSHSTRSASSRRSSRPSRSRASPSTACGRSVHSTGSSAATGSTGRCTTSRPAAAETASARTTSTATKAPSRRSRSIARNFVLDAAGLPVVGAPARATRDGRSDDPARALPRSAANPILTAADWPYRRQRGVQPGAVQVDGETVFLRGSRTLSGISHLTVARSANGIDGWSVDAGAAALTGDGDESEQWGFEDAAHRVGRGARPLGDHLHVLRPGWTCRIPGDTSDFSSVERRGIVAAPEDKNAALLPERVGGKWILFHRPTLALRQLLARASRSRVRPISSSWSPPEEVMEPRDGRLVGLVAHRDRAAAAQDRARLAARLPRRQGDRHGRDLPRRARARSIWRSRRGSSVGPTVGCSRRPSHMSDRATCRTRIFPCGLIHDQETWRASPLLRGRRHLDLRRDRVVRRGTRYGAQRAERRQPTPLL